jgi:hypothetical protein
VSGKAAEKADCKQVRHVGDGNDIAPSSFLVAPEDVDDNSYCVVDLQELDGRRPIVICKIEAATIIQLISIASSH